MKKTLNIIGLVVILGLFTGCANLKEGVKLHHEVFGYEVDAALKVAPVEVLD